VFLFNFVFVFVGFVSDIVKLFQLNMSFFFKKIKKKKLKKIMITFFFFFFFFCKKIVYIYMVLDNFRLFQREINTSIFLFFF